MFFYSSLNQRNVKGKETYARLQPCPQGQPKGPGGGKRGMQSAGLTVAAEGQMFLMQVRPKKYSKKNLGDKFFIFLSFFYAAASHAHHHGFLCEQKENHKRYGDYQRACRKVCKFIFLVRHK